MSEQNPYSPPGASLSGVTAATYNPSIISFKGRIGRLRYLAYSLGVSLLLMAIMVPFTGLAALSGLPGEMSTIAMIVYSLVNILSIVITVMFAKRRLNDLNRSGWYLLLFIVPVINLLLIIYLLFFSGTDGENDYGPQAVANTLGVKILGLLMPLVFFAGIGAAILIPMMPQS